MLDDEQKVFEAVAFALGIGRGKAGFTAEELTNFLNGWWFDTTVNRSIQDGIMSGLFSLNLDENGEPVIGLAEWIKEND